MRIPVMILAALLAFQANAQVENKLSISGRAWGSVENVQATTATNAANVTQRFRVTNDASYIRIRGDMSLSPDLAAWGQLEAQFTLDGIGFPFDSGRNTGVGFTSKSFGTIMAGRWDSPYKLSTIRLDPWGNSTINNYAAIVGAFPGTGNQFDARLGNGVQYWSPNFSGLQVRVGAVVNEDKTSGVNTAANINPSVLSASVTFDGPVYLAVAYETRKDCSNANGQGFNLNTPVFNNINCTTASLATHGRDWGLRAGAGLNFKPTHSEVGVVFERLKAEGDFAAAPVERTLTRDVFYASLVQGLLGDAHQFVGAIGTARKVTGNALATNDETAAVYYTAAYRYNFNKDLFVYGAFVQIRNKDAATYRFGSSGLVGTAGNPTGATYSGWSIGTRYLF